MKAQHGLGPLTVRSTSDANQAVLLDAQGHWVASIQFNGESLASVLEARAQLFAASAVLLKVLQELEESAGYWSEYDVPIGIVERISKAITTATGGAA